MCVERLGCVCRVAGMCVQVLSKDVMELKSAVLESFAGVEECRQMEGRRGDAGYEGLLRQCPLPASQREALRDMRARSLYLDSQLGHVHALLDDQWATHVQRNGPSTRSLSYSTLPSQDFLSDLLYVLQSDLLYHLRSGFCSLTYFIVYSLTYFMV